MTTQKVSLFACALTGLVLATAPAEFAAFYRNEVTKWGNVVRDSGAQID